MIDLRIYRLLQVLLLPLVLVYIVYHIFYSKKFKYSWRQRLTLNLPPAPDCPILHIQAASVGETIALESILEDLRNFLPNHAILITSLSETGHKTVKDRINPSVATYLPFDYPHLTKRFRDHYRPSALILMETEFWPNLIEEYKKHKLPVIVINGRISPKSLEFYLKFSKLYDPLLQNIDKFAAQTQEDAHRVESIGLPKSRIEVVGDIKFDQIVKNPESKRLERIRDSLSPPSKRILAAGSTHKAEHEKLLKSFALLCEDMEDLYLLLAPRHPEELSNVRSLLEDCSLSYVLRSRQKQEKANWGKQDRVLLIDTIGELAFLYDFCAIAFIGGSLCPKGGHSPLEPAVLAKAVLMGPHAFNFKNIVEALQRRQALRIVRDFETLMLSVKELFSSPKELEFMGQKAKEFVHESTGAARRSALITKECLESFAVDSDNCSADVVKRMADIQGERKCSSNDGQ